MTPKRILALFFLTAMAVVAPSTARAQCSADDVAEGRRAIRLGCDCAGATARSAYLACVRSVVTAEIAAARISPACRGPLKRYAAQSTCGRPAAVSCCIATSGRPWRATIRRDATRCRAPRNGSACVSVVPHLADACDPVEGCMPELPPDPYCGDGNVDWQIGEECEPPGSASCSAQCRFVSTCGNGVIEGAEECDGQDVCRDTCVLKRSACCQYGDSCVSTDHGAYTIARFCFESLHGNLSDATCEGAADACEDLPTMGPPVLSCSPGSCVDRPIEPVSLCCQEESSCRDTVATTGSALVTFACSNPVGESLPPKRLMLGTCGAGGRCVPAS